jgi:hypothetical protein
LRLKNFSLILYIILDRILNNLTIKLHSAFGLHNNVLTRRKAKLDDILLQKLIVPRRFHAFAVDIGAISTVKVNKVRLHNRGPTAAVCSLCSTIAKLQYLV